MTRAKPTQTERQIAENSPVATRRADVLLVERDVFESRAKAQAAIAAGTVSANGVVISKASAAIPLDATIDSTPAHPYVSRGGIKLAHALTQTGISVMDRVCLDVGASTGGFTQVLLAAGARRVYAVDVGTAQLHVSLRDNPKIISMENTDIRQLTHAAFVEQPDFAAIDVSFISLRHVIPATLALLARPAELIALVKPQFEVTRADLKKGVVRDSAIHERVCAEIAALITANGSDITAQFASPIAGGDGNREFFISARVR